MLSRAGVRTASSVGLFVAMWTGRMVRSGGADWRSRRCLMWKKGCEGGV